MRVAVFVGPGNGNLAVFESNRIDHQRISIPSADVVAEVLRIGVLGMCAPVIVPVCFPDRRGVRQLDPGQVRMAEGMPRD